MSSPEKTCGQHNKWHYHSLMRIFEKTKTKTKTLGEHLQRTTFETCTVTRAIEDTLFLPNQKLRTSKPYNQHTSTHWTAFAILAMSNYLLGEAAKKTVLFGTNDPNL